MVSGDKYELGQSKRNLFLACVLSVSLILSGCGFGNTSKTAEAGVPASTDNGTSVAGNENLTGSAGNIIGKSSKGTPLAMPMAFMIDNFAAARPQSGLAKADVVYEMLAEGMITRYMAIFYSQDPDVVGPIRSARPYFIDAALEYGAAYVHVGGSPQALADLKDLSVPQVDGLYSHNIYRDNHKGKKMPHNAYAHTAALLTELQKKGQLNPISDGLNSHFVFGENAGNQVGADSVAPSDGNSKSDTSTGKLLKINYRSSGYKIVYSYNDQTGLYTRNINGKVCVDEADGTPIAPANVIVQFADFKVMDDKGRLEIDLIGSGKGFLYTNGHKVPITWQKDSRSAATQFLSLDGEKVIMKPGQTWIQVVPGIKNIGG